MKSYLIAIALATMFVGCSTLQNPASDMPDSENRAMKSDFNKETYVWEDFIFTTNTVNDLRW